MERRSLCLYRRPVLRSIKGSFFRFSWGCRRPFSATRTVTLWIVSNGPGLLLANASSLSEDRVPLRADLGQSQSGNSSLSPQAYRVENPTADLAVSEILPITSVPAPRYFGGRSLVGAKVCIAKGGRTDRWPQTTAIPSRTILLWIKMHASDSIYIAHIEPLTSRLILLGVRVLIPYPGLGSQFQWNSSTPFCQRANPP